MANETKTLRWVVKEHFGTQAAAAVALGVTQQAISRALREGRVPAEWCFPIERATNGAVTRHQLRPDLWEPEDVEKAK